MIERGASLAISIFGGTTPLGSEVLVEVNGGSYSPAFNIMFFSAVAFRAARPLLGSVPVVTSVEEAAQLAKGQDAYERINTATTLLVREPVSHEDTRVG